MASARHSKRGVFAILGISMAIIVMLWVFAFERISYERDRAIQAVIASNDNLVSALEEHILRTVHGIDRSTLYLKYQYEHHGRDAIDVFMVFS
jgi:hypothetical protein